MTNNTVFIAINLHGHRMFPREGGGGVQVQSLDINIYIFFSKGGKGICISVPKKTYTQGPRTVLMKDCP